MVEIIENTKKILKCTKNLNFKLFNIVTHIWDLLLS